MISSNLKSSWACDDASSDEENYPERRSRTNTAQSEDDRAPAPATDAAPTQPSAATTEPEPPRPRRERREHRERRPRPPVEVPEHPPFKAYVGNLPYSCNAAEVAAVFENLEVIDTMLPQEDGKFKGFAYVEFKTKQNLEDALKKTGTVVNERAIHVRVAEPYKGGGKKQHRERTFGSSFRDRRPRETRDSPKDASAQAEQGQQEETPTVRKKLELNPRTRPLDTNAEPAARPASIFGTGKPREGKDETAPTSTTTTTSTAAAAAATTTTTQPAVRPAERKPSKQHEGGRHRGGRRSEHPSGDRTTGKSDRFERRKPQDQVATEKKRDRKERRKPDEELDEAAAAEKFQRQIEATQRREAEEREKQSKQSSSSMTNAFSALGLDEDEDEEN